MKYDNMKVRRQDRQLDEERAIELLREGEYGFLAFGCGPEHGGGYGIPISYVLDKDVIWFHCAPEGEKLDRIGSCNMVSFCVVGTTRVLPEKFTTLYKSVMVKGSIEVVEDTETKRKALALLVAKYSSDYVKEGARYAEYSIHRTAILRLKVDTFSGKAKEIVTLPSR